MSLHQINLDTPVIGESLAAAPSSNGNGKPHRDRLEFLDDYRFVCEDGPTADAVSKLTDRGLDTAVWPVNPPRGFRRPDVSGRKVIVVARTDKKGQKEARKRAKECREAGAAVVLDWPLYGLGDEYPTLAEYRERFNLESVLLIDQPWRRPAPADPDPADQGGADEARVEPSANGTGQPRVNEAPDDPHRLATIHLKGHEIDGQPTQCFYRGETLEWCDGAYRPIAESEVQSKLTRTSKAEFDRLNVLDIRAWQAKGENGAMPEARKVTRTLVSNVSLALQSMTLLPGKIEAPAWIRGPEPFEPTEVLPIRNALVHLPAVVDLLPIRRPADVVPDTTRAVAKPTPRFFSTYSLNFDFNLDADPPLEWLNFLGSVWPDDGESIVALQEWMGYLLTADTSHQKIGLFIGPSRSGRGTIARVITALLGPDNVAGPTFNSLGTNFGLSPLIGKPVAIVGDARISGRSDWAVIVERLLSISGEDAITVDRKHLPPWTGRLRTRLILISNELPRLPDVSGALVNRYLVFRLTRSFLGKEDKGLDAKLESELPGILLWAIEGWHRLRVRGHFVQPKSGQSLIDHARDISSPMGAFIRERCEQGTGFQIGVEALFNEWCSWCEPKKREPGNETSFGRDLRTVIPDLEIKVRRGDKSAGEKPYVRFYEGVRIREQENGPVF